MVRVQQDGRVRGKSRDQQFFGPLRSDARAALEDFKNLSEAAVKRAASGGDIKLV